MPEQIYEMLCRILDGLGEHYGAKCEFSLCGIVKNTRTSILKIVHGEVSGRKIGSPGEVSGIVVHPGQKNRKGTFGSILKVEDGKYLRCSTILLYDDSATAVGELSLVSDVTEMVAIERAFREYLFPEGGGDNPPQRETSDIDETLSLLINESIHRVGVPVAQMNRLQKAEGVRFLQKKGAFKVTNAGSIVARFYDISKFTIYNYLDGPRDKRKPKVAAGHDAEPAGD